MRIVFLREMEHPIQINIGPKRDIIALAYEELSVVAQGAVSDSGQSLYDVVIPHSTDVQRMCRMVDEAFSLLRERLRLIYDVADRFVAKEQEEERVYHRLFLNTPDNLQESATIQYDTKRYFVLFVIANYLRERYKVRADEYGQMCQSQLQLVISEFLTHKQPTRRC